VESIFLDDMTRFLFPSYKVVRVVTVPIIMAVAAAITCLRIFLS
jgi:hypothetical protein